MTPTRDPIATCEPAADVCEHTPKVVVGRRALQQLAERAGPAMIRSQAMATVATAAPPGGTDTAGSQSNEAIRRTPAPTESRTAATRLHSEMRNLPAAGGLAAALEVDRLDWPEACSLIIKRAKKDLDTVVKLLAEGIENGVQVVAVTGASAGDGATTIVLCLSQLAARDLRVCMVDANFQRPSLAESLGLAPERDLAAVLRGEATAGDVLIESLEDHVTVLPLNAPVPAELLERSKLRQTVTLGELREQFDLVLLDAGPVFSEGNRNTSILQAATGIDATIMVRSANSGDDACRRAGQTVAQFSMPCLGVIENRSM
jgi:Mrp family chromosome partitioning ATPase